jgi:predicted ATPase
MGVLAGALCKARQPAEGLRVLEEALAIAHRNGEQCHEAELYRLKGELLLATPRDRVVLQAAFGGRTIVEVNPAAVATAESSFDQAIKIARQLKARSSELRGALSLARLYQNQGKPEEARILLEPIYNTFTEGFDTLDLREAKSLLNELGST